MPAIVLGEYRDQHGQRSYPFLDSVTLTDNDGWTLPTDFIIDLFMYPIDLVNGLYIYKIVRGEEKLYFADTVTKKIHGVATIGTDDTAYVYEPDGLERQVGIVTFGDGKVAGLQGNTERIFEVAATELTPTAYIPLNQPGVRAVRLDAEGTVVTGPVKFEGRDGVRVTSYYGPNNEPILEFSIIGIPPVPPEECFGCNFIREICVHREPGSTFMLSEYATGVLALDAANFSLDDVCTAQRDVRLPDEDGNLPPRGDDVCDDPPVPPDPPGPGDEVDFCWDVRSFAGSSLYIITPSTEGDWNPIHIQAMHSFSFNGRGPRLRAPTRPVQDPADIEALVDQFRDPPELGDALSIGFKGLAAYRRPKHA